MTRPTIFLDIDGPLNNERTAYAGQGFDPVTLKAVFSALRQTKGQLVITSARRTNPLTLDALLRDKARILLPYLATEYVTPALVPCNWTTPESIRAAEIHTYCASKDINLSDCLIIDDLDMREQLPIARHVIVSTTDGLRMLHVHLVEEWAAQNAA